MLVIDEAFDCWREGKNPFDYHVVFDDWWQRDLDAMLLRDRNHPSIVLWSIGNEVHERDGRNGGAEVARRLTERVRAVDPTRPVISAICGTWDGTPWENTDAVFAHLDVGGYNYLWRQYEDDHARHPARMMIGTESIPGEAFENWMSVLGHSHVLGDFVWTSLDYLGESGIGRVHYDEKGGFLGAYPWHQANCGDLDLCGFKRPQSFYRDILWQAGTQLYIAAHAPTPTYWGWPDVWPDWNWAGHEGKTFQVDVYSACAEVELLLNGQSLGRKPTGKEERFTARFEVPYAPGELKAVGYRGGEAAAEAALHTNSAPASLRLTPDREEIPAAPGGLSYISVEILDENGRPHPAADRPVYFTVKGPGMLKAVGSANPVSTESYVGNWRSTHRGRCLAVVQSNGQPGEIRLRAQADGLDGSEVVIKTL